MKNVSGIYYIESTIDSRLYVGSSKNVLKRKAQHFDRLRKGTHPNKYLQNFYNKHGEHSLELRVVEKCLEENLLDREQVHIDTFDEVLLFNISLEVSRPSGTSGMIFSEKHRKNISKSLKGRKMSDDYKEKRRAYMRGEANPMSNEESVRRLSDSLRTASIEDCCRIWKLNQEGHTPKSIAETMGMSTSEIRTALNYSDTYLYPYEDRNFVTRSWKRKFNLEDCEKLLKDRETMSLSELAKAYGVSLSTIKRSIRRANGTKER